MSSSAESSSVDSISPSSNSITPSTHSESVFIPNNNNENDNSHLSNIKPSLLNVAIVNTSDELCKDMFNNINELIKSTMNSIEIYFYLFENVLYFNPH